MRKCLRCDCEMVDDYKLLIDTWTELGSVKLSEDKGIFSSTIDKLAVVVCPQCGYVEMYL